MSEEPSETQTLTTWQTYRVMVLVLVAAAVVGIVIWGVAAFLESREADQRSDEYYCTLSGVSQFDRAPNTGELCIDLG